MNPSPETPDPFFQQPASNPLYRPPTASPYPDPARYPPPIPAYSVGPPVVPPPGPAVKNTNMPLVSAIIIGASIILAAALAALLLKSNTSTTPIIAAATSTVFPTASMATTVTTPSPRGVYPFEAMAPGPNCVANGTAPGVVPEWQVTPNSTLDCRGTDVAVVSHTPTTMDDEIFFMGLQGHPFPNFFQTIVYVDISQANAACAGLFIRPYPSGVASRAFFVCGAQGGYYKLDAYDPNGKPTLLVKGALPEGSKHRYQLTIQAYGNMAYFSLDSLVIAMPNDMIQGGQEYVGLGVDASADNAILTDTTLFSQFQFRPKP